MLRIHSKRDSVITVNVKIDEAWSNDFADSGNNPTAWFWRNIRTHSRNLAIFHGHIQHGVQMLVWIDDCPSFNEQVIFEPGLHCPRPSLKLPNLKDGWGF